MSTLIKRLYQQDKEFVPITLSEAVVVNTSNIVGLSSLGITTLDKVLQATLGLTGTNAQSIATLNTIVEGINNMLDSKQNKLTAGAGIEISESGVISTTASTTIYKIVTSLPAASQDCTNIIYLLPSESGVAGNLFTEYLCVDKDGTYFWETLGELSTDVNLENYVTKETFNTAIGQILSTQITASDVTTSSGVSVAVDYVIPDTLYDSI